MWTLLAEKCRRGLKVDSAGKFPFEEELKMLFHAPAVAYMLLPLPTAVNSQKKRKGGDGNKGDDNRPLKKQKGAGKGQDKFRKKEGKGSRAVGDLKPGATFEQIPELKGCWIKVRGDVVCPKYNLGTCPEDKDVKPGDSCSRGKHCCCFPKCFALHKWCDHHKK